MKQLFTALLRKKIWRKKRFWAWLAVALVTAFLLFIQLLPTGIRWNAQYFLRKMNAPQLAIRDVDFNLFLGKISIHNLINTNSDSGYGGEVGATGLQIKWRALQKKQVSLTGFTLNNATLDVTREADGTLHIGGLTIPAPTTNTQQVAPPADKKSTPWGVGVDAILLDNLRVNYKDPKLALHVALDELHVSPFATWQPDMPTTFSLRMQLNGGSIRLRGEATPFSQNPTTTITLQVKDLPLEFLNGPLSADVRNLAGAFGMNASIRADYDTTTTAMNILYDGAFDLKDLHAETPLARLQHGGLGWNGTLQTSGTLTSPTLSIHGAFDLPPLLVELTSPSLRLAHEGLHWQGKVHAQPGRETTVQTSSSLSLKDLALRMPAADNASTSQSLALTQSGFEWRGVADYSAATSGSLTLDGALTLSSLTYRQKDFALERMNSLQINPLQLKTGAAAAPQSVALNASIQLGGVQALLESAHLRAQHEGLDWKGTVTLGTGNALETKTDLSWRGVQVTDVKTSVTLANLVKLELKNTDFKKTSEGFNTSCTLAMTDARAQWAEQKFSLGKLELHDTALSQTARGFTGNCNLLASTLKAQLPDQTISLGKLELQKTAVSQTSQTLATSGTLLASDLRAQLSQPKLSMADSSLSWRGECLVPLAHPTSLTLSGTFTNRGLAVQDLQRKLELAGFDSLDLRDIQLRGISQITVRAIALNGLRAFQKSAGKISPAAETHLFSLKELALDTIQYQPGGVQARAAHMAGLNALLALNPQGELDMLSRLPGATPQAKNQPPQSVAKSDAKTTQTFAVQLEKFEIIGDNKVVFDDTSVNPPVRLTVQPLTLTTSQIDTTKPTQPIPVNLQATLDTYGTISFEGNVTPLAEKIGVDGKTSLKQINLTPLSPYTERAIGYRLKRGALNTDLTLRLNQGDLDALCEMLLTKLELERLKAEEMDEMGKQLGLPVNTALALLRDGNDNITLKIPVQGNLNDPQVRISNIVLTALKNSLLNTLSSVLSPLGLPLEAGKWITGGKSLGLKPVEFLPASSEFTRSATEHLSTLVKTLKDRPGLQITLSGVSARFADTRAIANQRQEEERAKAALPILHPRKDAPEESGPPIPKEQLLQMAEDRAKTLKDYLTKQGIQPERLLLTTPSIDEKREANPRVDLSL